MNYCINLYHEEDLTNPPINHQEFLELLSQDVYSESDGKFLYKRVLSSDVFSPPVKDMMSNWIEDENHHHELLKRVYRSLGGPTYGTMSKIADSRECDFSKIEWVLEDELSFLLCLAFDELGSTFSYRRDLTEFYGNYSRPIRKVCQRLVQDEGKHFQWAISLILDLHPLPLTSYREGLRRVNDLEHSLDGYDKTFLLDHAQERHRFSENFNDMVIERILKSLSNQAK